MAKNQFVAGDFVWCKIDDNRTHPWWPGRIHKREDASDSALTAAGHRWRDQARRLLVALFGNGSFSWSVPGQEIVPFVEHFRAICSGEMSRDFTHAVNEAVDEFTRAVDLGLTCRCVGRDGMTRTVVVNDGVKEGVLAPEVDVRRLAVPSAPSLLSRLGKFATQNEYVPSALALKIGVMKGCLSAFYRTKGINQLLEYQEPYVIEGLEDQSSDKGKAIVIAEEDKSASIAGSAEDDETSLLSSDAKKVVDDSVFPQAADVHGSSSVGGNSKQKLVVKITETTTTPGVTNNWTLSPLIRTKIDSLSKNTGQTLVKDKSPLLSSHEVLVQKQPPYVIKGLEDQSSDKGKAALVDPAAVYYGVRRSRTDDLMAEEDVSVSPGKRQKRAGSAKDDEKYLLSSDMMKKKTTAPTPDEMNMELALAKADSPVNKAKDPKTPEAVKEKEQTTAIETTPTAEQVDANNPLSQLKKIKKRLEITEVVLEKYHEQFPDNNGKASLMEQMKDLMERVKVLGESVHQLVEDTS